jgi:hypothetical protein
MTDIDSLKRRLGKEMIHIDGCKEETRKGNVIKKVVNRSLGKKKLDILKL